MFFCIMILKCKDCKQISILKLYKSSDVSTIINIDIDKYPNLLTQLYINYVPFADIIYNNQFLDGYFKNVKFYRFKR
ncbi:unnamed protein product [Paramecium sonneborni]|uniref:Uncharacterized protein n=1 Tax=Paramecium sonneborni TaxID=65129 RepID=A0A8S1KML3_9CILI|nr:unnamed protein product [Paramecium sonneborni]